MTNAKKYGVRVFNRKYNGKSYFIWGYLTAQQLHNSRRGKDSTTNILRSKYFVRVESDGTVWLRGSSVNPVLKKTAKR